MKMDGQMSAGGSGERGLRLAGGMSDCKGGLLDVSWGTRRRGKDRDKEFIACLVLKRKGKSTCAALVFRRELFAEAKKEFPVGKEVFFSGWTGKEIARLLLFVPHSLLLYLSKKERKG